jgi:hypothetical protein
VVAQFAAEDDAHADAHRVAHARMSIVARWYGRHSWKLSVSTVV